MLPVVIGIKIFDQQKVYLIVSFQALECLILSGSKIKLQLHILDLLIQYCSLEVKIP